MKIAIFLLVLSLSSLAQNKWQNDCQNPAKRVVENIENNSSEIPDYYGNSQRYNNNQNYQQESVPNQINNDYQVKSQVVYQDNNQQEIEVETFSRNSDNPLPKERKGKKRRYRVLYDLTDDVCAFEQVRKMRGKN